MPIGPLVTQRAVPVLSFRVAAYGVCIEDDKVLLAHCKPLRGRQAAWSLPGGRVEHGEDPIEAVVREVAEETGCDATVERLLGVDSRQIPAHEAVNGSEHQNIGIFYQVRITGGQLRPEPNGDVTESIWAALADVPGFRRSSLVDIGLALASTLPPTGHVPAIPVGGLIQH
jgi:8-oxo-dGTP diphosphatase